MPGKTSRLSFLRVFVPAASLLLVVLPSALQPVSGLVQSQDRTVTKLSDSSMPVEVKAVKTKKGTTSLGRAISDDEDWFNGLTVSIENTSGKTIVYIGGGFLFPKLQEPGNGTPPKYHRFMYGQHPGVPGAAHLASLPLDLKPGGTLDITLSKTDFASLKRRLKQLHYPDSIKDIKFNVAEVYFNDGTAWIAGDSFERDPNDPEKYQRVKPPALLARKKKPRLSSSRQATAGRPLAV